MPLPVIADCARVTLNWESSSLGPPTHNVIHIMKDPARSYTYLGDNFAARLAEVDVNGKRVPYGDQRFWAGRRRARTAGTAKRCR